MASSSAVECTATVGDAELLAGAQHAQRDLAAVGDEDFFEHRPGRANGEWRIAAEAILSRPSLFATRHSLFAIAHSMIISGSPNSTGWPSSIRIWITVPAARRGDLVHGLHRLDDQQRFAGLHLAADLDERPRAGLRPDIGGADHRRGDDAGMLGRIGRSRIGDEWVAGMSAATGAARAAATTCVWRATRTRWPSRSNSISVRPVSSSSCASSRIRSWSTADFALFLRSPATGQPLRRAPIIAASPSIASA